MKYMEEKSPFADIKSQLDTIPEGVPVVFISYSWDNEQHKEWVLNLSKDLREKYRVYTLLDRYNRGGDDLVTFMRKGLKKADRVLIIGTPTYLEKVEKSKGGGAKLEDQIISISLYKEMDSQKFIPVLREGSFTGSFNELIETRFGYDMTNDGKYEEQLNALAADLWGQPMNLAPSLGPKPNFTPASQVLQPTIPETPQDFATLVKRYLPDPSKQIILDELLEKEVDDSYKKIIQYAQYNQPMTSEIFNKYKDIHQDAISNLLQTVVPMVRYGDIKHIQLLVDAIIKLCKKPYRNGEVSCVGSNFVHLLAATYLFHAVGVACVKYKRFDMLLPLVTSKVDAPNALDANYSYSLQYLAGCTHWSAENLNIYMGTSWYYPYSFLVTNTIRPTFGNIFFDNDDFMNTYYVWEHLASLMCRYYENYSIQKDWNPLGNFVRKRISILRQTEDFYTDFFKTADRLKDEWLPIKQGLFGGSYRNYQRIYEESETFYKTCFHY